MPTAAADDTIEIATTAEERGAAGNPVVSYTFRLSGEGGFTIDENWAAKEEIFADGRTIRVPPRIWALVRTWLAARRPRKEPFRNVP